MKNARPSKAPGLFRHLRQYDEDEGKVLMRLQLLGLDETAKGCGALGSLIEKVRDVRHALGLRC